MVMWNICEVLETKINMLLNMGVFIQYPTVY